MLFSRLVQCSTRKLVKSLLPHLSAAVYACVGQSLRPRYKSLTILQDFFIGFLAVFSIYLYASAHIHSFTHIHSLGKHLKNAFPSQVLAFAAVAFGTLSQGVPFSPREVSIGTRAQGPVQLKGLLRELKTQLVIAVAPISTVVQFTDDVVNPEIDSLTRDNATVPYVLPILQDVDNIFNGAAKLVEDLVTEPVDELLEGVNDVLLTADDVLYLTRDVLTVVFDALEIVYQLITDLSELLEILPVLV